MAGRYILFPSTYKGLGEEIKQLLADYSAKQIGETEMIDTLKAWSRNCDFMLEEDGSVAPGLITHIGKRRSRIIASALRQ